MIVQIMSVVLGFFMAFFAGYATNVFLTRRKKEIGIYIFMGLTNQKIGRLYMLEMAFVGCLTLAVGIGFGVLTAQLFQMVLLAISDITVEIGFHAAWQPVVITSACYIAVYLFFVFRGYLDIVKSSVLSLVSASRQNEYVRQPKGVLLLKAALGIAVLSAGFFIAVKEGGQEVINYVLLAVILVVAGVYFLFAGLIPLLFQGLAGSKAFLYHKERCLWVNQMVFRMKKNYRTYAVACVLMICSVTALAASFALRERYNGMVHFRNTYTYQLLSALPDLDKQAVPLIEQENEIECKSKIALLAVTQAPDTQTQAEDTNNAGTSQPTGKQAVFVGWSQLKQLAQDAGLAFDLKKPENGQVVELEHMYLMSFYTKREGFAVKVAGKDFWQAAATNEPYLGYLQEMMSFYLVNDEIYESLKPGAQQLYAYNYRISNASNYKASVEALGTLVDQSSQRYTARIVTGPDASNDSEWVKVFYSLCVFLVLVFISASGSILFMKLYNDAFEERERYGILQKLGCPYKALKRAAACELLASYTLPFFVMVVASYFSVKAMENMMYEDLTGVRLVSIGIIFVVFFISFWGSIGVYLKNAGVGTNHS